MSNAFPYATDQTFVVRLLSPVVATGWGMFRAGFVRNAFVKRFQAEMAKRQQVSNIPHHIMNSETRGGPIKKWLNRFGVMANSVWTVCERNVPNALISRGEKMSAL